MKIKKLQSKKLLLLPIAVLIFGSVRAQMVGTDAYLKGTAVEIGISGLGGFEGAPLDSTSVPLGLHFRSNNPIFGFVANPQNNAWTTFDGDFFSPGSPENGWGFQQDTILRSNNSVGVVGVGPPGTEILGAITSWTHTAPQYLLDWEGDYISAGTNLHFKINYELSELDLFYITTVTVTNNTADTIPEFYYYRNLDPDNNVTLTGDYMTHHSILSQPYGGGTYASVCGEAYTPWSSYFSFITEADPNWRAGYGGFSNRNASDMWNATGGMSYVQTIGAGNFADEAIYVSYKINDLPPAGSETFKFCSTFSPDAAECAQAALRMSHAAIPVVSPTTPAFVLSGGSPAGGTYTGTGVIGGTTFDPSISGAGDFPLVYSYTDTNACTSTANVTVHVDVAMGVNADVLVNTVVYPNPVGEEAVISISRFASLDNASLHLFDVLGKEIRTISNISSYEVKIDRAGLSNGVYFYKLYNGGKEISSGKILMK